MDTDLHRFDFVTYKNDPFCINLHIFCIYMVSLKTVFIIGQKMALKAEIVFLKVSVFGRVVFFFRSAVFTRKQSKTI